MDVSYNYIWRDDDPPGWGTSYFFEDYFAITGLAPNGNGLFRISIQLIADEAGDWVDNIEFEADDILAPAPPQNLVASNQNDHPFLTWNQNVESDLQRYRVYRLNADPNSFIVTGTSFSDQEVVISQSGPDIYYYVKAEDWEGNLSLASNQATVHGYVGKQLVFKTSSIAPEVFTLDQNYPNPFNPTSTLSFALPAAAFTTLSVYNSAGQNVATLVRQSLGAGNYQVIFDAGSLPSGVYFYRLSAGNFTQVKRMLLVK